MTPAKVSVVIGTYNRLPLLQLCLNATRQELAEIDHEIIVVDGGSDDGTIDWLVAQKDVITIVQHNRGEFQGRALTRRPWAYFMNLGFQAASATYVCMLSDDSLIVPGAILNGIELFDERLAAGEMVAGVAFYFRDYPLRKEYAVAVNVGQLYVNHGLYLRAAMHEVGYCDEDYSFYFADTDLCMKLVAAGYQIVRSPRSFVEHYFDATPEIRASNNDVRKDADRQRLIDKWCGVGFPSSDRARYERVIGFWDNHPEGFRDHQGTIQKLIQAAPGGAPS